MITAAASPVQGPVLRDIHLPPDPPLWPPAPGWWVLAGVLLLCALLGAWLWRRQRALQHRRGELLAEVDRLAAHYRQHGDPSALASGAHQLLRRVARRHDALAAQQRGQAWRRTLARMPVDDATLQQLLALEPAIYRRPSSFDHDAALEAVGQWLRLASDPRAWKPLAQEPVDV